MNTTEKRILTTLDRKIEDRLPEMSAAQLRLYRRLLISHVAEQLARRQCGEAANGTKPFASLGTHHAVA